MKLLIVDDEKDLNTILVTRLKKEGYNIDNCYRGDDAWYHIQNTEYDGIILDIMLPVLDGISILKKMRASDIQTPVLFLTSKSSVENRVAGLDAGANDYLTKPFAFEELSARIRCMTRSAAISRNNILQIADLIVDCNTKKVTRSGKSIELTGKEFSILEYMLLNQGHVLSKEKIEQHIWHYDFNGDSDIVKVYIRYLRKKIDDGYELKLIHTARSFGYILKCDK